MVSPHHDPPRFTDSLILALVWAVTTGLRWLTLDFENDYFMHVSWAAEIRRGALPVRDFVEPGFPLQTLISYWSMMLGGNQLALEGFIAAALIGAGAACTYAVCRRLGLGVGWALVASAITVFAYPRLYGYPKAFAYPAALLAIAAYVQQPRPKALVLLALTTAVAFLLRHDHGVWIAVTGVVTMVVVHRWDWRRSFSSVLAYGAVTALFALPWLVWVVLSGNGGEYVRWVGGQGADVVSEWRWPDRVFTIDRDAPLVSVAPRPSPEIGIRWGAQASPALRREREAEYGLIPAPGPDAYRLRDSSRRNVLALLRDPLVEDTRGIDRRSGRVPPGAFAWATDRLLSYVPVFRVRPFPGVVNEANALPWLTYTAFALPWAVLLVAWVRLVVATDDSQRRTTLIVLATALLGVICYQRIVRGSPDSRLGDVAAMSAVLIVYLTARSFQLTGRWRWVTRIATCLLLVLTMGSAVTYGRVPSRLAAAGVDGPINLARRANGVLALYRQRPLDVFAPPGSKGLPRLARWLHECTSATQRVSVIGFEPEVNVWSERGFAGGLAYFDIGFMSDPRDQAVAVERWRQQDVPFALLMTSEAEAFARDYTRIDSWVTQHYVPVRTSTFGGGKEVTVLMRRTAPRGVEHADTGLPCPSPQPNQPAAR